MSQILWGWSHTRLACKSHSFSAARCTPTCAAAHVPGFLANPLKWDIYLTTANDVKESIFSNPALPPDIREQVLFDHLPRFQWRATAFHNAGAVLDLLFDATDIEQGKYLVVAVKYDAAVAGVLQVIAADPALMAFFAPGGRSILQKFA